MRGRLILRLMRINMEAEMHRYLIPEMNAHFVG